MLGTQAGQDHEALCMSPREVWTFEGCGKHRKHLERERKGQVCAGEAPWGATGSVRRGWEVTQEAGAVTGPDVEDSDMAAMPNMEKSMLIQAGLRGGVHRTDSQ